MSYLKAEALVGGYGGAMILNSCTIAVDRGRIAVIVGPNGAGKSTAMKAILGLLRLTSGRVLLDGRDITALPTQARISAGMAFVPQTDNVFPSLSVFENHQMGALLRRDPSWAAPPSSPTPSSRSSPRKDTSSPASFPAASASSLPSGGPS